MIIAKIRLIAIKIDKYTKKYIFRFFKALASLLTIGANVCIPFS